MVNSKQEKTVLVNGGARAIGTNLVRRLNRLATKRILMLGNVFSSINGIYPRDQVLCLDVTVDNPETDLMINVKGNKNFALLPINGPTTFYLFIIRLRRLSF